MMRELVGARVQFAIGELLLLVDEGDCIWGAFDLLFKELMQAQVQCRVHILCVVPTAK